MGFDDLFALGGVVGRDLSRIDWEGTPLGPPERWPPSLTTVLRVLLTSRFSMWMAWGPELTFFCNDAYRHDTLGAKYPWALGRPAWEVWGEIWDDIGPRIGSVLDTGVATWDESLLLFLERSGYREETYHTFSYSPLADDAGRRNGMICVVAEETDRVVSERRMSTLRDVAAELTAAQTERDVFGRLEAVLGGNPDDLPFAAVYLFDDDRTARRVAVAGLPGDEAAVPPVVDLPGPDGDGDRPGAEGWPAAVVWRTGAAADIDDVDRRFPSIAAALGDAAPRRAVLLPLPAPHGAHPAGFFLAGLTPFRPPDGDLRAFARLLADQVASALVGVRSLEAERTRAEALAELDRVKTQFFANVSHEFRTPLTLIAAPIADLRAQLSERGDPRLVADIEVVERNALRLGKLVDAVLDFSRVQAGHLDAQFEPLDLTVVTAELVSMFRPAIEKAGLELVVDCRDLGEPVFIDVAMWEKVVLNLLSNALKFTLAGRIGVSLERDGDAVVLTVDDTGVGIPPSEQPRLFERFHRVERTQARSSEGSGIGLALVAELVALHGGRVDVDSELGHGSTFTVRLPFGSAHLPPAQVAGDVQHRPSAAPESFLSEALRWTPEDPVEAPEAPPPAGAGDVLVVDDNADMRAYLSRLLGRHFGVRTAVNGAEALAAIAERVPDLVLSDVMMPEVDGIALVQRIRGDDRLVDLPVVLLTAATDPERANEGLDVGADDYIGKPFTAEDLVARVGARLAAGVERRQRHAIRDLAATLADARTPADIVRRLQPFLAEWLRVDLVSLAVVDGDRRRVRLWHGEGYDGGMVSRYLSGTTASAAPIFEPLRTGERIVLSDLADVQSRYPAALDDFEEGGVGSTVVLPLTRATGDVGGSLALGWRAEGAVHGADLRLAERLAVLAADAFERVRVTEQEHRVLQEFQAQLLEIDDRSTAGVVAVRYQPAESALLVGGDWYDVLTFDDASLGVGVGDVVGKGLPAATVMSQLRSAARVAAGMSLAPHEVIATVDDYARRLPGALGASAAFVRLDASGTMTWMCAGHPPPVLVTADGVRMLGDGRRPLLGCRPASPPVEGCVRLPPGALVLLYTDGLVERAGEELDVGFARLTRALAHLGHLPVGALCDRLLADLAPPSGFRDDVALVAVRVVGRDAVRFVDAFPATPRQVRSARHRFGEWLEGLPMPEATRSDVLLAFSEASTNALEHGSRGDPRRAICVEAACHGDVLVVAVTDRGEWQPDSTMSRQRLGRGRGFTIMTAVTDAMRVEHGRLGTTVTFEHSWPEAADRNAPGSRRSSV